MATLILTGDLNLMNVADPNVPFALSFPKIISARSDDAARIE